MIKKGEVFYPTKDFAKKALLSDKKIYEQAAKSPVRFWSKLANEVVWQKRWQKAFVHNPPYFKWFVGGKLNITESCLDENLKERKNKIALIWEPESPDESPRHFSYYDLYREVCRTANGLRKIGIKKGDRVAIYLPVIPETVIAMLACARIGAIHSVIFSAFSPASLKTRIEDTEAKFLITADGYYRRGKVIDLKASADKGIVGTDIEKVIVVKRAKNKVKWNSKKDLWWDDIRVGQLDNCPAKSMDSEDPLFILYNSGSLGKPKEVVHTCGGYTVQAKFSGRFIFDIHDDDIFWSTADLGWVTGHTYSVYSQLLNGATFVIFEGAPDWPQPTRWCQIIEKYGVTIFYTAPTAIRMFKKYGADLLKEHDLKTLRVLGSVGEMIDQDSWLWFFNEVGGGRCPIVDTWWQTETGGILITSLPGIGPFRPAFTGLPFPGVKAEIFDENGKICKPNQQGDLVILPPYPPGMMRIVYNKNKEKYIETYWTRHGNKVYFSLDLGFKDKNGLIRVIGRDDDVIKVAGHRISTGEMEDVISKLSIVSENAVVGIPDSIKGEIPVVFVLLKKPTAGFEKKVVDQIRKEIGPIALPKEVYLVDKLPKTRSGKIMRRILKGLLTDGELGDLSTLSDMGSIDEIKNKIKKQ